MMNRIIALLVFIPAAVFAETNLVVYKVSTGAIVQYYNTGSVEMDKRSISADGTTFRNPLHGTNLLSVVATTNIPPYTNISALTDKVDVNTFDLLNDYTQWSEKERKSMALTVKEINSLRNWIADFKQAVADSTSLSDLKAKVAALPNMPLRTKQQVITALRDE